MLSATLRRLARFTLKLAVQQHVSSDRLTRSRSHIIGVRAVESESEVEFTFKFKAVLSLRRAGRITRCFLSRSTISALDEIVEFEI